MEDLYAYTTDRAFSLTNIIKQDHILFSILKLSFIL